MEEKEIVSTVRLPLWKNLEVVAIEWEYGSEHTHSEIESILGLPRMIDDVYPNSEYYDAVSNVNTVLTRAGKHLVNINGVGYRVLAPDDYPAHVRNIHIKSMEVMRYAVHVSVCSNRHLMSPEKRDLLDRQQATIVRQILNNSGDLKQLYAAKEKTTEKKGE